MDPSLVEPVEVIDPGGAGAHSQKLGAVDFYRAPNAIGG